MPEQGSTSIENKTKEFDRALKRARAAEGATALFVVTAGIVAPSGHLGLAALTVLAGASTAVIAGFNEGDMRHLNSDIDPTCEGQQDNAT